MGGAATRAGAGARIRAGTIIVKHNRVRRPTSSTLLGPGHFEGIIVIIIVEIALAERKLLVTVL